MHRQIRPGRFTGFFWQFCWRMRSGKVSTNRLAVSTSHNCMRFPSWNNANFCSAGTWNKQGVTSLAYFSFYSDCIQRQRDAAPDLLHATYVKPRNARRALGQKVRSSPQMCQTPGCVTFSGRLLLLLPLFIVPPSHVALPECATTHSSLTSERGLFNRFRSVGQCMRHMITTMWSIARRVPIVKNATREHTTYGVERILSSKPMEQRTESESRFGGVSEFIVYCSSDEVRDRLLRDHSSVLKRASDRSKLRLYSASEGTATLPQATLDVLGTLSCLSTQYVGRIMVYADIVPSTQDVLQDYFRGLPAGTVAVTGQQSSGRGRRGSIWESPVHALAFSVNVTVPIKEPHRLTFVQYVAALAAVECLTNSAHWSCVPLRIKWPNDLLVNGVKVGGVLCEASSQGDRFNVVVGVGINISNRHPTTCLNSAFIAHGGDPANLITRDAFLAAYLNSFETLYDQFRRPQGLDALRERYVSAWLHANQEVRLESAGNRLATVVGLAPNGYVRVRCNDSGKLFDLAPDVTSLDLSAGVMRVKQQGPRLPSANN